MTTKENTIGKKKSGLNSSILMVFISVHTRFLKYSYRESVVTVKLYAHSKITLLDEFSVQCTEVVMYDQTLGFTQD